MKAQRVIRVLIAALLIVTLGFCFAGCTPSDTENNAKKDAENIEIENYKKAKLSSLDDLQILAEDSCHEIYARYIISTIETCKAEINRANSTTEIDEIYDQGFHAIRDDISYYRQVIINGAESESIKISGGSEFDADYEISMKEDVFQKCLAKLTLRSSNQNVSFIVHECGNWTDETTQEIKPGKSLNVVPAEKTPQPDGFIDIVVKNGDQIIGYSLIKIGEYTSHQPWPQWQCNYYSMYKLVKAIDFENREGQNVQPEQVNKYIEQAKTGIDGEPADDIKIVPCSVEEGVYNVVVKNHFNDTGSGYSLYFPDSLGSEEVYECIADVEFGDGSTDTRKWTAVKGDTIELDYSVDKNPEGYLYVIIKNGNKISELMIISVKVLQTNVYKNNEIMMKVKRAVRPVLFINFGEAGKMTDRDLSICIEGLKHLYR